MINIIFQAIKLSPRLFWQSLFQPSKVYDFVKKEEKNVYIFIWAFFFIGLLLGSGLAVGHYYLYKNLVQSILFAFALSGIGAVAGSAAVTFSGASSVAVAFALSGIGAVAGSVTIAFLGASSVVVAVAVIIAVVVAVIVAFKIAFKVAVTVRLKFIGVLITLLFIDLIFLGSIFLTPGAAAALLLISAVGWFILYLNEKKKVKLSESLSLVVFSISLSLLASAGGIGFLTIKPYETIIYPLSFLVGYFFFSQLYFIDQNQKFKKNFQENNVQEADLSHQKFAKAQKTSIIIWGLLLPLILCLLILLNFAPGYHTQFLIAAIGFAIMPIFILHIPDYLICLPGWWFQRRNMLKKSGKGSGLIYAYKKSLLFKHEMLYLPLPGLHKIMAAFARNKEIGIKKALKEINHIYWFTFQQKQAEKALETIGKDFESAHHYIHIILEENNHELLKSLSKENRLSQLYLKLFEKTDQKRILEFVCREISREKEHRFNDAMLNTLMVVHHLLEVNSLKDFYQSIIISKEISGMPPEISYFPSVENVVSQLKKIKYDLGKIEFIERFESRCSFYNEQKKKIEALGWKTEEIFYEPFKTLWKNALFRCSEVLDREIKLLRVSAVLAIDLRNKEIMATEEEQTLYFDIINKSQEFAFNISITLYPESPGIFFIGDMEKTLSVIEANTREEILFCISARNPIQTSIEGVVTFSDRAREGKQIPFSFSITVLRKSVVFKEIQNPYIVGPALKGDAPLFFGREDAFDFIDKNILASGEHHTIVCHGLRRTGKTSLLYHIEYRGFADKRLVPINIDMQGIANEKHLYSTLSHAIARKLSLPGPGHEKAGDFREFKGFLEKIKPGLGEKIIVLMLDEFEAIQTLAEDKRIPKTTFNNIRHLMQHEEKLIFLFCGTHKLEEMSADYWSIFFNTAIYYRLSHLLPGDAVRLIKEPIKGQLTYDDLAVEQILKMTGGQPYLVQLLCRNLVNDLNENKKKNDVLIDDVDDTVEHIIKERGETFSRHIWDGSNWNERLILSSAAEELTRQQWDHIGMEALFNKIKTAGAGIHGQQLMEALEKLVSKEILQETEMRYCFPVNLLRKWIAARFPLKKVLASGGQEPLI